MPISSNCVLHDFSDLNVVRKEFCVFRIPQNTAIRSFSKSSTLRISKGAENSILNGTKKTIENHSKQRGITDLAPQIVHASETTNVFYCCYNHFVSSSLYNRY